MPESKVVLLIEDEKDIRDVYTEVLKGAGYEVLEADNGEAGLSLALNSKWDLMLLDIMIPKMDGISMLKRLKADENLNKRPIILLTNLANDNLIKEAFDFGADGYLIKAEITPDHILKEVHNFI